MSLYDVSGQFYVRTILVYIRSYSLKIDIVIHVPLFLYFCSCQNKLHCKRKMPICSRYRLDHSLQLDTIFVVFILQRRSLILSFFLLVAGQTLIINLLLPRCSIHVLHLFNWYVNKIRKQNIYIYIYKHFLWC